MLFDVFQSPASSEIREILKDENIKTKVNNMVNEYLVHFMDQDCDIMNTAITVDALGEEMEKYHDQAIALGADKHDQMLNAGKDKMIHLWKQGKPFSAMKFVTFYGWHCHRLCSQPCAALRKRPRPSAPVLGGASKRFFSSKWTKKVSGPVTIGKLPVIVGRKPIVEQHSFVPLSTIDEDAPWADREEEAEYDPNKDPFMEDVD